MPGLPLIIVAAIVAVATNGQSIDYFDPGASARRQQQPQRGGTAGIDGFTGQQRAQQQQIAAFDGQRTQQQPQFGGQQLQPSSNPYTFGQGQPQQQQRGQMQNANSNPYDDHQYGRGIRNSSSSLTSPISNLFGNIAEGSTNSSLMAGQRGSVGESGAEGNVQVEIQLRAFANSDFRLPDGRLCTCPRGNERCLQASPQRNGYNCLTSLAIFVLSADDKLRMEETPYMPLNAGGQLGQQEIGQRPYRFLLDTEPSAIGVVVHNLGPQIDTNGQLYETNTVTTVDTFIQPLSGGASSAFGGGGAGGFFPSFGGGGAQQQQNVQLQGKLVGTQLSLSFSVSCRGARSADGRSPLVGPGCDLSCNSSVANPTTAICQSQRTGFFSLCRWFGGNSQVTDCKNCPWGIKENAYCADEQGGVLEPNHAGVVSSSYYTAFIVLCTVCGLLLLCVLVALLLACKNALRQRRDAPPARRPQPAASSGTHRGDPERALLTAGTRPSADDTGGFAAFRLGPDEPKPPPPYSIRSAGSANPSPFPRSNASTASAGSAAAAAVGRTTPAPLASNGGGGERPRFPAAQLAVGGTKVPSNGIEALSPPRFQPLPHLGPAAGADSLNSSFAGLPPPSVSADV